jgi:hypothetical protein
VKLCKSRRRCAKNGARSKLIPGHSGSGKHLRNRSEKHAHQVNRYIALPSLAEAFPTSNEPLIQSITKQSTRLLSLHGLPDLKASILIGRRMGDVREGPHIMVHFFSAFRRGSDDLVDLSSAIDVFQQLGGMPVRNACNNRSGIWIIARDASGKSALGSDSISFRLPSALPFVPKHIKVYRGGASDAQFSASFLEGIRWTAGNPLGNGNCREVDVMEGSTEFLRGCARQVCLSPLHSCDSSLAG